MTQLNNGQELGETSEPLSQKKLFTILVETGRTIITIKSENKLASRLPYLPIDRTQGLFKNQLISFKYGRTERNALRELHANVSKGGVRLVRHDSGASPMPLHLKTSTVEITPIADGKHVFKGTIGNSKYLFDTGNGEIVLELKSNRDVAAQAAIANRVVVPRHEASRYAVKSLIRRWHQAKKGNA